MSLPKNLTPRAIHIVDETTHKSLRVFPSYKHVSFDVRHTPGKSIGFVDSDIPCKEFGDFHLNNFSLTEYGINKGDTVILDYEDAVIFKKIADANDITIFVPSTHINQCIRDRFGEVVASYYLLQL